MLAQPEDRRIVKKAVSLSDVVLPPSLRRRFMVPTFFNSYHEMVGFGIAIEEFLCVRKRGMLSCSCYAFHCSQKPDSETNLCLHFYKLSFSSWTYIQSSVFETFTHPDH